MKATTTWIRSIEVLGKVYEVKLSREMSGFNYSVKGSLVTFGWSAGDMEEAIAEAKSHIIYNNTPGKWIQDS
mgnify:CR=1 FL=1